MKLTLATYGFFVLPMRGERCVGLVAPANAVEEAAHRAELLIDGVVEASTVPGISVGRHHTTTIPLERCRLRFGTPEPAAVSNFDLILEVSDLFCGGLMAPGYATGGHSNVVVDFSGGSVAAAADGHTGSREWTITDCSGAIGALRRLTSLLTYAHDRWTGRLTFDQIGRPTRRQPYLQFSGRGVTLALRYVPAAFASASDVNLHHVESTKPLLLPFRKVNQSLSGTVSLTTDVPRASLSPHVAAFLGLGAQSTVDHRVSERDNSEDFRPPAPPPMLFEGDPHCSMRRAQVLPKRRGEHLDDLVPPVIPRRA